MASEIGNACRPMVVAGGRIQLCAWYRPDRSGKFDLSLSSLQAANACSGGGKGTRALVMPDGQFELPAKLDIPPGPVQVTVIGMPELPRDDPFWTSVSNVSERGIEINVPSALM
jgi:hypothetical protein